MDEFVIEARPASFVNTRRFGASNSLPLPLLNKLSLHLGNHSQNRKNDLPHISAGRDVRVKDCDVGAPLLALVDDIKDISRIPP